jgi:DoxX-like family
MPTEIGSTAISKKALWTGWIVSALPVLMLLFTGVMKLLKPAAVVQEFGRLGYPENLDRPGDRRTSCTLIYIIPRTTVLGAILLAAYLGGATATHVRIGDPFFIPIVLGILVWLGLYLRDSRLRVLVPLTN